MTKIEALQKFPDLKEGLTVRSLDGEKLGRVIQSNLDNFVVEKGFFFPKDFVAQYDEITEIIENDIILNREQNEYAPWRDESFGGWSNQTTRNLGVPPDEIREPSSLISEDSDEYKKVG